ncbi:hypothetical protein ACQPXH_33120 (plasmid) [Nocardia sp. CA-135953]|uniref:hypothetical protein n=1 Tax=Nocardia sp. CA-135953 TaxID=3239978 RepID=UPI003D96FD76
MSTPTVLIRSSVLAKPVATVHVGRHVMTSKSTPHSARYVGVGKWVVDYLPGRQLTKDEAITAMKIAAAPQRPEVGRWAATVGLTAAEAVGMAAMRFGAAAERAIGADR